MAAEHRDTAAFRGATVSGADLSGATFRDCDLRRVRIVSSQVDGLVVCGFGGKAGSVVVDDVDVTVFVAAELDRRHPERVQLRALRTAEDHRAMGDTVERLWADTVAMAQRLPETARQERVDGEWSLVETLRHLVFAVDVWVGRMILDQDAPYHRLGLPPTDSTSGARELGIDLDARPSFAEAVELHADRLARLRGVLTGLTEAELDEVRTAAPIPQWGIESHSVGACLRAVLREHCEHRRFAVRDLARLEADAASG